MPQTLGAQNARVAFVRDLLTRKGRESHRAYAVEGATLLDEAVRSERTVREIYVTGDALESTKMITFLERRGVPTYLVGDRTFAKISDVETPTGVLAVLDLPAASIETMFAEPGLVLLVADLSDPGNLGTLLRAAEAFGARGAIIGDAGVDPFHPKVVRAGMGAHFRLPLVVADPEAVAPLAEAARVQGIGLAAGGAMLREILWPERTMLVVGHERHGIGRWEPLCAQLAGIPMVGSAESLNAGVAGSIALYEASINQGYR